MLEKMGVKRLAYDYRAEHIPQFDTEMEALKRHGIELTAWWFPATMNDEARLIRECAQAGGFDGMSGRPIFAMDGMRGEISAAIVEILHELIAAPASRKPARMSTPLFAAR